MANHEWSLDELRHKAEAYCASAEHCSSDVQTKLLQWGASANDIEQIIPHLKSQNYINEERYCRSFAHDKLLYQGWGRRKIQAALFAKRLPSPFIDQALDSIDETEYFDTLKRIIATKKRGIKANDSQAREKMIRFCMQRGFTYDEIGDLV